MYDGCLIDVWVCLGVVRRVWLVSKEQINQVCFEGVWGCREGISTVCEGYWFDGCLDYVWRLSSGCLGVGVWMVCGQWTVCEEYLEGERLKGLGQSPQICTVRQCGTSTVLLETCDHIRKI